MAGSLWPLKRGDAAAAHFAPRPVGIPSCRRNLIEPFLAQTPISNCVQLLRVSERRKTRRLYFVLQQRCTTHDTPK